MAKGNGKNTDSLTVEILKQIRDNTEMTAKQLGAVKADIAIMKTDIGIMKNEIGDQKGQMRVLIEGQIDLARNVGQLNLTMIRLVEEVKDLRDDDNVTLDIR